MITYSSTPEVAAKDIPAIIPLIKIDKSHYETIPDQKSLILVKDNLPYTLEEKERGRVVKIGTTKDGSTRFYVAKGYIECGNYCFTQSHIKKVVYFKATIPKGTKFFIGRDYDTGLFVTKKLVIIEQIS